MKALQVSCVAIALAIAGVGEIVIERTMIATASAPALLDERFTGSVPASRDERFAPSAAPWEADDAIVSGVLSDPATLSALSIALGHEPLLQLAAKPADGVTRPQLAELENPADDSAHSAPPKRDLSYLRFYAYAEIPPPEKPADTILNTLKDVPVGTPVEEIRRASDALGLDFSFMKAVAKIESDFDPTQRTGSYLGLFQLSHYEFARYGSGDIFSPRDNAVAAAYKFVTEALLFRLETHKTPSFSDLYLIHQQGWQGAAEHVAHPDQIAWKSMCDTDEGREKGEHWCKRAIWQNTLPAIKHLWKSVDDLTSSAFVDMWRQRVNGLYARYSEAEAAADADAKH
jgi:hypothetical protein